MSVGPKGQFLEILTRQILVGTILVGTLVIGVRGLWLRARFYSRGGEIPGNGTESPRRVGMRIPRTARQQAAGHVTVDATMSYRGHTETLNPEINLNQFNNLKLL